MSKGSMRTGTITLSVLVAVLMLASVLFVMAPAVARSAPVGLAPPTASGSVTYDPTTYGESLSGATYTLTAATVLANGGTFGSGSTVYFYVSTTSGASGIATPFSSYVGSFGLPGGTSTLTNAVVHLFAGFSGATNYAGSYDLLASDSSSPTAAGAQFTTGTPITIVLATPSVVVTPAVSTFVTVGSTATVTGGGWDGGASVSVSLNTAGGSLLVSTTASSTGTIAARFTVPALSGTVDSTGAALSGISPYTVVAQETNALSGAFPEGGITASTTMKVGPSIAVSPMSTGGASGSVFTITGSGFAAGQTITAFPVGSPGTSPILIGGVNTYFASAVLVGSTGGFAVSVTLAIAVTPAGPALVKITLASPAATDTFSNTVYVSVPGVTPTLTLLDRSTGSTTTGAIGDTLLVTVWSFPASSTVSVYFGSTVFALLTDANGFAQLTTQVPNVPDPALTVIAEGGGYSATYSFTVTSTATITDSSGAALNGEYASVGSVVTIHASGLAPYEAITITDTGLATTSYATANLAYFAYHGIIAVTISAGSLAGATAFAANGAGTLTVSYALDYAATVATGTSKAIATSPSIGSATYIAVNDPTIAGLSASYAKGATVTLGLNYLVPSGARITPGVTPETVPYLGPYSFYIDGTVVTLATSLTTFTTATSTGMTAAVSFVLSASVGDGVHTLSLKSAATTVLYSNAELLVSTTSLATGTVVVSTADSSVIGGTGTLGSPFTGYPSLGAPADNAAYGIEFDLYNFPASTTVGITVYGATGTITGTAIPTSVGTDAHGAAKVFVPFPAAIGNLPFLMRFSATAVSVTGANWYYATVPAVSFEPSSFASNGGVPGTDYYAYFASTVAAGSSVIIYANSLLPDATYNVFLGTSASFVPADFITSFTTDAGGDLAAGASVALAASLTTGTYYIDVAPASSSATTTSLHLTVEVTQFAPAYAFPGQLVNVGPIAVTVPTGTQFYQVTITFNGSAYATLDVPVVSGGLSFSFAMPNGLPGNYFTVGYTLVPVVQTTNTVGTAASGTASTTTLAPTSYSVTANTPTAKTGTATFTGVLNAPTAVTGLSLTGAAGTTVTGVSVTGWTYTSSSLTMTVMFGATVESTTTTATIASGAATYSYLGSSTVTTETYGTAVTAALTYPTTLVSGNGALITGITPAQIAEITTAVNQTLAAPIAELNAAVVSINGAVVEITTSFGTMTTTLSAISATVNTTLVTVTTGLGTITTNLADVQNGIVTIQSTLGTVTATLGALGAEITGIGSTVGTLNSNLTSLNATVGSLSSTLVTVTTSLGTITTTLGSIDATVTSTATSVNGLVGSVVEIQTTLGSINGTVTAINGNIATIQTKLGTLQASVNAIPTNGATASNLNTLQILMIVGLVLIAVTLAIAVVALVQSRRARPPSGGMRVYEQK